jgi:hypothetical protein
MAERETLALEAKGVQGGSLYALYARLTRGPSVEPPGHRLQAGALST